MSTGGWYAPWLLGLMSTILSVIGSWHVSIWTDEAATISAARRSIGELWRMIHSIDVVHGTYYAFMHYWIGAFGSSPFSIRLPSALAIGMATVGVYLLGRQLSGPRAALLSAAIFMILPRVLWAGIEARPYAFTVLLATWCTLALLRALESTRPARLWFAYGLLLALCVLSNVYLSLLAVSHLLSLVLDHRVEARRRLSWVIPALSAAVVTAPLGWAALHQTGQLGGDTLTGFNLVRNIVVNQWFLGDTPTTTRGIRVGGMRMGDVGSWWAPAAVALAVLGLGLVIVAGSRAWRERTDEQGPERLVAYWALPWLVVPTVVIGMYSMLVHPMYSPRYLTFSAPALSLLVARGLLLLHRQWLQLALIAAMVVLVVPVYISQRQVFAKNSSDWVAAAGYLNEHKAVGDGVYFPPRYPGAPPPIGQTSRQISIAYPQFFTGLIDLTIDESPAAAGNLTGFSRLLSEALGSIPLPRRIWVLQRRDYPAQSQSEDRRALEAAHFTGIVVWQGPLDEIVEYTAA